MAKSLHCSEIFPACAFVAHGASDDEVVALAMQHAQAEHDMAKIDWEVLAKYCGAIRNGDAQSYAAC